MGISFFHAELLIREHRFRPLPKTIHLIGRQTVLLTPAQLLEMLSRHEIDPKSAVEIDRTTSFAIDSNQEFVSDTTFFGMLGVDTIRAIDHSDFEGADIILDLNKPIAPDLAGSADFIFGGSVLDNVFDPGAYIRNITRLLAPGGRLVDQNAASFHYHPYVIASPAWYLDYFVLNEFDDCKIYFQQGGGPSHIHGLEYDPADTRIGEFGSAGMNSAFSLTILAEKGAQSSWDRIPSQDQYREPAEWSAFHANAQRIKNSARRYEVFAAPSASDLARVPLRRSKSFRYLGALKGANDRSFDGVVPQPARQGIRIIEASFGLNLLGQPFVRPAIMPLCAGNATEALSQVANGHDGIIWAVDVNTLGDPAPDMAKELLVEYTYFDDPAKTLRQVRIPAPADGRELRIPPLD